MKHQQNGKTHTYTYYHCSKKSKKIACDELCIREEELDDQISKLVRQHFLPPDWAKELLVMIEKDVKEGSASQATLTETTRTSVREIKLRLERLLDTFLDQDIEREAYLEKKVELMGQKKTLEEKTSRLSREQLAWVEPMQKWIEQAQNMENIAQDHNLFAKKVAAKEIFGSNLLLTQKKRGGDLPRKRGERGGSVRKRGGDWKKRGSKRGGWWCKTTLGCPSSYQYFG